MNVLLGPEIVCKFNNLGSVFLRREALLAAILGQDREPLHNVPDGRADGLAREQAVLTAFPRLDFICFQEVFDRAHGLALATGLRPEYPHFVLDVAANSPRSNFCMLSSGLALASRFPILRAIFVPFTAKRGWQWCLDYGALLCKVDLGSGRVGILANLHTVAYQGKEQLIREALTQLEAAMADFREETVGKGETLEWEVIGGDFNFDNISPGDRACAEHSILRSYEDPAMAGPGTDVGWTVGTETRQGTLHTPEMRDPASLREILLDDVRRRHYILDADVEEQTMELMTAGPRPDGRGEVVAEPWGGRRRIDKLLYRMAGRGAGLRGAAAVTALAGLTDHVPIVLTLGSGALRDMQT
jgi:sphingomyelin phosphodiesterase 3